MRRRELIVSLGAVAAFPATAHAQQQSAALIGFLGSGSAMGYEDMVATFRRGLGQAGFGDGANVTIDERWAEGHYERLPALAAELLADVSRQAEIYTARVLKGERPADVPVLQPTKYELVANLK